MKKDDWKKILDAWEKKQQIKKTKRKSNEQRKYFPYQKKICLQEIDAIEDFILNLTPEERAEYDFIDDEGFGMSKMDININFSQVCVKWHFYLNMK